MASRSPTAATPLPKSSVAPESPFKEVNTILAPPQTVPFPPPQTFEILPQLHGILLRLLSQKPAGNVAVGGPEAHPDGQQPPSNIPGGEANDPAASQAAAGAIDPNVPQPLDVKDLPTETHSVKIRIQKARVVVEGLPDVQRSVEEQEDEISELEDRVARLRSVISDFGTRAGQDPLGHPRVTVT
ncbi:unnamed protein product [Penicillium pancosmium]